MSKRRQNRPQLGTNESARAIATVHQSISFSGPLPHPDLLERYNEVIPNGADRIMAMAERQGAHRESLEAQVVAANIKAQARGALYAFIICLVVILGGFGLLWIGKSISGFGTILTGLAGLVGVFVFTRREQRKERVEKEAALVERRAR